MLIDKKASLELHLGTIPSGVGWGRSNTDYKAISVQLQMQLPTGTELGNKNQKKCSSYHWT